MPPRKASTSSGWAASSSSTTAVIAAGSLIIPSPFASTISPGEPPFSSSSGRISLAILPLMVPFSISCTISASWAGRSGSSAIASRLAFTWAAMSPVTQLATPLGSPPAATAASKYSAMERSSVSTRAS